MPAKDVRWTSKQTMVRIEVQWKCEEHVTGSVTNRGAVSRQSRKRALVMESKQGVSGKEGGMDGGTEGGTEGRREGRREGGDGWTGERRGRRLGTPVRDGGERAGQAGSAV